MRPRRTAAIRNYAEEEESCSSVDHLKPNLHDMETQRMDWDNESASEIDSESDEEDYKARSPVATGRKRVTRSSIAPSSTPKQNTRTGRATRKSLRTPITPISEVKKSPRLRAKVTPKSVKSTNSVQTPKTVETPTRKGLRSRLKQSETQDDDDTTRNDKDLAGFMASLNASPSPNSSPKNQKETVTTVRSKVSRSKTAEKKENRLKIQNLKKPLENPKADPIPETCKEASATESKLQGSAHRATDREVEALVAGSVAPEVDGKLRSSTDDLVGLELARSYRRSMRETEEYALNFISSEFHHPAMSCFRDVRISDIKLVAGSSKLKKSLNTLEQSVAYLGMIDYLATVSSNPVYSQSDSKSTFFRKTPATVKKILLEWKNLLGSWALSGNEQLSGRYTLIMNYLRVLVPMFKTTGFDQELNTILGSIEQEINRLKMSREKLTNGHSIGSENVDPKLPSAADTAELERSALNEIVLNVDLKIRPDESDDEEVSVLKADSKEPKIFGKPLKKSVVRGALIKKKIKKAKSSLGFFKSTANNSSKVAKSLDISKSTSIPVQEKSNSSTTPSSVGKRTATEELHDVSKKRKVEDESKPGSTSNHFKPTSSDSSSKPTVNAFALMMKKSKEIAQMKKLAQAAVSVPTLKVDSVKT